MPIEDCYFGFWIVPPEWKGTPYARRRAFFEEHPGHCQGHVPCPACGYPTLSGRASYEICSLCWWEDDGHDDPNAHEPWGGPNDHSLDEARRHFETTCCMWPFEERDKCSPWERARLFDARVIAAKRRLRAAYDALLTLSSSAEIHDQWLEIDERWGEVLHFEKVATAEVDRALRRKQEKGGKKKHGGR